MRILFLALESPYPPTKGHRIRTWAMLKALLQDGHQVTLLGFSMDGDEEGKAVLEECCERVVMIDMPRRSLGRLRGLFSSLPYGGWRFRSRALQELLGRQLAGHSFDLILCDGLYNMVNLPPSTAVPVFLNKDDVSHIVLRRYLDGCRNPVKFAYVWQEYWKLRRWEATVCSQVHCVLACSDIDRQLLQQVSSSARIEVVPNVIDTSEYLPTEDDDGRTVIFAAAMDWYPNRDAVELFVNAVLPELRRLAPGVRFVAAGRNPPQDLLQRYEGLSDVEFTGTVPDIRSVIARAAVCVVPLRIGSGTRLKIIEAAAMAKAVVSTTLGAEGLNFRDGEEIILADEPKEFARGVARLLGDAALRRALGAAARRRVEREYSLPVLQSTMRAALPQASAAGIGHA